ncbi:MAG: hypothetical protein A2431_00725 [Candidatus Zambryskibacteria bacterium RIFOXYC1_FULL_39_10]|uniref:J domain-containing protein n=1 Tax=Candidatus Zambryskibacteria bacterium RIFOXYC1_FULL_39_10 TaxID=1802779 RepID=A0A1G2UYA6_9BACT|nr:MAG: hypothetical protein A2431_00725 [Candidatus Zambryskibacteria bacterium RIFOXYC1_FULL_39_10]OHB16327.1 MAG: hypothetical protein A2605_00070 [Candidatus Zambryskibacteria bacterium RIFOXYD1_FULL_39_35]
MATNYTVSQAPVLASAFLNITLPTSMDGLKKAFRKKSRQLHPDLGGDPEEFKQMVSVYEFIVNIAHLPGIIDENGTTQKTNGHFSTVEGLSIFDLGLGLGPTKNGKDCPRCQHKGYTVEFGFVRRSCPKCNRAGSVVIKTRRPCKYCRGTGKFRQARTGRVVDCNACKGSGMFEHNTSCHCFSCLGTGTIFSQTEEGHYLKCVECGGKGEIEIHNPVLPKGRLF